MIDKEINHIYKDENDVLYIQYLINWGVRKKHDARNI